MHHSATTNWELGDKWAAWRSGHPESTVREDARVLGVSEAELVATGCGDSVTRLRGGWVELLRGLQELGPLSVQTESNGALIEASGVAVAGGWSGRCGMLRVGASRLRVRLDAWYHGYAVRGDNDSAALQFFGSDGQRLMTVVRGPESMRERWTQLVRRFTSADQNPWVDLARSASAAKGSEDRAVDARQLRRAWDGMQRTEDWSTLLQRFDLTAAQAIRQVGDPRALTAAPSTFKVALRCAANAQVPLSLTVETAGAKHNYTGLVRRVENVNEWFAVVEPGLRLYVCEPRIKTAWLVRRPAEQATVSAFHYFDAADQSILTMTGNTIPGEPGLDRWERMVASL